MSYKGDFKTVSGKCPITLLPGQCLISNKTFIILDQQADLLIHIVHIPNLLDGIVEVFEVVGEVVAVAGVVEEAVEATMAVLVPIEIILVPVTLMAVIIRLLEVMEVPRELVALVDLEEDFVLEGQLLLRKYNFLQRGHILLKLTRLNLSSKQRCFSMMSVLILQWISFGNEATESVQLPML